MINISKNLACTAALSALMSTSGLAAVVEDSLVVSSSGNVGVGIEEPATKLHIFGDGDDVAAQILVENANTGTPGTARKLFQIANDGPAKFSMFSNSIDEWAFAARDDEFRISKQGSGSVEMKLDEAGNLEILGSLTEGSSRTIKHDIEVVDARAVLEKVVAMPIATWSYNRDPAGIQHLGPMAEDFYSAFGLGHTAKGIASVDTSGVALAAIQGLKQELDQREAEITELQTQKVEQDERILQLELALAEVLRHQSSEVRVSSAN